MNPQDIESKEYLFFAYKQLEKGYHSYRSSLALVALVRVAIISLLWSWIILSHLLHPMALTYSVIFIFLYVLFEAFSFHKKSGDAYYAMWEVPWNDK